MDLVTFIVGLVVAVVSLAGTIAAVGYKLARIAYGLRGDIQTLTVEVRHLGDSQRRTESDVKTLYAQTRALDKTVASHNAVLEHAGRTGRVSQGRLRRFQGG